MTYYGKPYGKEKKVVVFESDDGYHARLIIKLRHHRLGQGEFFRELMRAYIEDDPRLDDVIEDYRKTKKNYSKTKEAVLTKERKGAKEISDLFALDEDEIQDIYDLFEEEEEDLI